MDGEVRFYGGGYDGQDSKILHSGYRLDYYYYGFGLDSYDYGGWLTNDDPVWYDADAPECVDVSEEFVMDASTFSDFLMGGVELRDSNRQVVGKINLYLSKTDGGNPQYYYMNAKVVDNNDTVLETATGVASCSTYYDGRYRNPVAYMCASRLESGGNEMLVLDIQVWQVGNQWGAEWDNRGKLMQLSTSLSHLETLFGTAVDIQPVRKTKDPNIDRDPHGTTDDIPKGDKKRGGQGTHDYHTDIIPMPVLPTLTATKTGFVTLYSVTETTLELLADKLFTDSWAGAIENYFQNADEVIAGLSIVPFTPTLGPRAKPRVGLNVIDLAMYTIANQYVEVPCGEVEIEEFYGSAFDYSPYTKISIYLPYVGIRALDVDEVMAHKIGVKYFCDAYSGSCMACIYVYVDPQTGEAGNTPTLKYTFSGNIAQQVPTAAASWDRMIQSGIALACVALPMIAATGVAGIASASKAIETGVAAGASPYATTRLAQAAVADSWANSGSKAATMALEGATMATAMSAKPTVERTGSLGSGVGFLGPQKPFLILEIPRQSIPVDYMKFNGYPSNESAKLGDLEGYVQVEDIHLTEVYATGPEKDEIVKLLKEGVIL